MLYLLGDTVKYLGMPKGEPSYNLFNLINEDLRPKLLTLLHRAVAEKKLILAKSIPYRHAEGEAGYLNVSVRPLEAPDAANLFLAVFEEVNPPPPPKKIKGKNKLTPEEDSQVAILEHELQATREYLQTTVEELEASNEELKSTNEELQSTNEELQSTNEELETAKEELQSTNEELVTVNAELNNKIYELIEVNNDINNLLASTEIGTLFLDRELRIRRFTPAATHLFNLIPTDVGRSIKDIAPKTENENIWEDTEHGPAHPASQGYGAEESDRGNLCRPHPALPHPGKLNRRSGDHLYRCLSAAPPGPGQELRGKYRGYGARVPADPERRSEGNLGQPDFLCYL